MFRKLIYTTSAAMMVGAMSCHAAKLDADDLAFLREMTRAVVEASRVKAGANGGGNHPLTNSCGFTLITPGKDTYRAFWPRDFSMAVASGFITAEEMRHHLELICRVQNGSRELQLANGLHVPAWAIPDHINYDGRAVWFPGTMNSGQDQGTGVCGRMPPLDDDYEFVHIAFTLWKTTGDEKFLGNSINGVTILERLEKAFARPTTDPVTGLVETTEDNRAVGFGFCDAEAHTGKLLFASLLRYRAAGELAELCRVSGFKKRASVYKREQRKTREHVADVFGDAKIGWLRGSTGLSRQPDVWGTVYALNLGVLDRKWTKTMRRTLVAAVKQGTITYEGGLRHVPTNCDFSRTTAWERSIVPVNTYQNGGYWHTASGWLIEALWDEDRALAVQVYREMISHLQREDFRKGAGHGAPWEVFGRDGQARQNAVYMASVALPYAIVSRLNR